MPFSIFKRLELGEAKPTTVSLQLADRLIEYPYGVIEDVLLKVEKLILPVDFLVLDMEEDKDIPIILGRPFLATSRTLIDIQKGELTMRVQDQEVTFNVFKAMKFPNGVDDCFRLDVLDTLMFASPIPKEDDLLQNALTNLEAFDDEVKECCRLLDATPKILAKKTKIDPLPCKSSEFFSSSHEQCKDRCEDTNFVLNWKKCHFMVREGVVLGHKISSRGIEADHAKIDIIAKLPPPTSVKGVRSFLGHAGFYRRFIKDFSKISKYLCNLLEKDVPFVFDTACMNAFLVLKEKLTSEPIIATPNWNLPFELMCDASDHAIGAVLGQ
ncbi:uncharacterized protein LOC127788087 [Diospyros lotus]|uniref:uncharacterized protein LOC127788087 n=1 Tax=Diospyros lotus TaxID=55363 RepID=UPI00224F2DBE|nr:uncharacterized protein LOC127788087 [Diospyros lotus]